MTVDCKKFIVMIVVLVFSGCQITANQQYNNIVKSHNDLADEANKSLEKAIVYYNNKDYAKSLSESKSCEEKFKNAQNVSTTKIEIAKNIKNETWIGEFNQKVFALENLRISQCKLLQDASMLAEADNSSDAQIKINELADINDKFKKINITLEDIKNQHLNSFK